MNKKVAVGKCVTLLNAPLYTYWEYQKERKE
jgi:hypothetical protein